MSKSHPTKIIITTSDLILPACKVWNDDFIQYNVSKQKNKQPPPVLWHFTLFTMSPWTEDVQKNHWYFINSLSTLRSANGTLDVYLSIAGVTGIEPQLVVLVPWNEALHHSIKTNIMGLDRLLLFSGAQRTSTYWHGSTHSHSSMGHGFSLYFLLSPHSE